MTDEDKNVHLGKLSKAYFDTVMEIEEFINSHDLDHQQTWDKVNQLFDGFIFKGRNLE